MPATILDLTNNKSINQFLDFNKKSIKSIWAKCLNQLLLVCLLSLPWALVRVFHQDLLNQEFRRKRRRKKSSWKLHIPKHSFTNLMHYIGIKFKSRMLFKIGCIHWGNNLSNVQLLSLTI